MSLDNRLARYAEQGMTESVLELINESIQIVANDPDKDSLIQEDYNVALIWAAANNRLDTIKALIDHGADINKLGSRKHLPLCEAARMGKTEATELLLKNGADPKLKDCRNKNALEHAKSRNFNDIVELIMTYQ